MSIINLPYSYINEVVLPRKRNSIELNCIEFSDFIIKETDDIDLIATVGFNGEETDYYHKDGKFYTPLVSYDEKTNAIIDANNRKQWEDPDAPNIRREPIDIFSLGKNILDKLIETDFNADINYRMMSDYASIFRIKNEIYARHPIYTEMPEIKQLVQSNKAERKKELQEAVNKMFFFNDVVLKEVKIPEFDFNSGHGRRENRTLINKLIDKNKDNYVGFPVFMLDALVNMYKEITYEDLKIFSKDFDIKIFNQEKIIIEPKEFIQNNFEQISTPKSNWNMHEYSVEELHAVADYKEYYNNVIENNYDLDFIKLFFKKALELSEIIPKESLKNTILQCQRKILIYIDTMEKLESGTALNSLNKGEYSFQDFNDNIKMKM